MQTIPFDAIAENNAETSRMEAEPASYTASEASNWTRHWLYTANDASRKSTKIYENLRESTNLYDENLRKSKKIQENLRESTKIYENPRKPTTIYENPRESTTRIYANL